MFIDQLTACIFLLVLKCKYFKLIYSILIYIIYKILLFNI